VPHQAFFLLLLVLPFMTSRQTLKDKLRVFVMNIYLLAQWDYKDWLWAIIMYCCQLRSKYIILWYHVILYNRRNWSWGRCTYSNHNKQMGWFCMYTLYFCTATTNLARRPRGIRSWQKCHLQKTLSSTLRNEAWANILCVMIHKGTKSLLFKVLEKRSYIYVSVISDF
jgi:membrane-bound metal-dependent hydrolase YbcI (DUF457 family)